MIWRCAPLLLGIVGLLSDCGRRAQSVRPAPVDAGAGGTIASAPPRARPELTILYTSDLRGHVSPSTAGSGGGLARRATLVDRVKLEGGAVVQVDAGDLLAGADDDFSGSPYSRELRTHIVLASYDRLGVNAVTLGERDLELGREGRRAALRSSEISVVAANVFGRDDERLFPPDKLIEAGGQSVGVFGILDVPAEQAPGLRRLGFRVGDAGEAARAEAQSLRSRGARLVVGLLHVVGGRARAEEILAQASGIDLVILGHAGDGGGEGGTAAVGRTPVVFAGTLGAAVGRIDVRSLEPGAEPQFDDQKVALADAIPEQVGVASIERAIVATLRQKSGQKEPLFPPIWTFASNEGCGMCHTQEVDQWNTTEHARAYATLKKYKRDRDPECLGCHMTGYLQPGQTTNHDQTVKYFSGVGCESCHGPSAAHVRAVDKRTGTSRTVAPDVCLGCHTADQTLVGSFEYAAALKAILGPGHGALAGKP